MKISVVIPAYNEEEHIAQCLGSLLAQTVLPDEIIVVDNNSKDRTTEIASRFPLVKVLNEPLQGIVHARNKGFDAATGDIIGRSDSDTIFMNDWVEKVKNFFAESDADAVTGPGFFYGITAKKASQHIHTLIYYKGSKRLLGHEVLWGSNMAIRRSAWEKIRFEVCNTNEIHEDIDLAIHLAKYGEIVFDKNLLASVSADPKRYLNMELKDRFLMWPKTKSYHKNLLKKVI